MEIPGLGATRIDVPRPSSESVPCTVALRPGESIADRVAALRGIGLFADRAALSDEALGAEIEAAIEKAWGDQIAADDPLLELFVADQDATRVWWRDLEADVAMENDVYPSTLEEWAAISAGAFTPTDIDEAWESEAGPVKVRFEMGGATHELTPEHLEDWIDPRIATPINELIANSGRQFAFFKAFDQTAFVMALTETERAALKGRGWCFD